MKHPQQATRIAWIDAAKGFCILAVVLYHFNLYIYHQLPTGSTPIAEVWQIITTTMRPLRMPLFFMLSGFLAHGAILRRSWAATRTSKIASLLWVYVFWFTVYWLVMDTIIPPNPLFHYGSHEEKTVTSYILRAITADNDLWYLLALVMYFTLAKVLRQSATTTMIIALIMAQSSMFFGSKDWNIASLLQYFLFFAIGTHFKHFITSYFASFNYRRFCIILAMTLGALVFSKLFYQYYDGLMRSLVGLLMCATAAQGFAFACRHLNLRWLRWIGRQTLPIYVLHMLVISSLAPIWPMLDHPVILALEPLVATIAVVAVSLTVHRLLMGTKGRALFTMPHTLRRIAYRTHLLQPAS